MRDRRTAGDSGFTLLEVMFVVLVLGILVSIAVSSFAVSTERSLRIACHANLRVLGTAVAVHQQEHGDLPLSLSDLDSAEVAGRIGYDTCPDGDLPYTYNGATGEITCANHLLP